MMIFVDRAYQARHTADVPLTVEKKTTLVKKFFRDPSLGRRICIRTPRDPMLVEGIYDIDLSLGTESEPEESGYNNIE